FSPGDSPQPPRPRQVFSPPQVCALAVAQALVPAQSFLPPLPSPLQVFRPRQTCGSCNSDSFFSSFGLSSFLSSFLSSACASAAPATKPPRAAIASFWNWRRLRSLSFMLPPVEKALRDREAAPPLAIV